MKFGQIEPYESSNYLIFLDQNFLKVNVVAHKNI